MTTSYAKIEITGTLTVLTGLQIGAGDGFSAISARSTSLSFVIR